MQPLLYQTLQHSWVLGAGIQVTCPLHIWRMSHNLCGNVGKTGSDGSRGLAGLIWRLLLLVGDLTASSLEGDEVRGRGQKNWASNYLDDQVSNRHEVPESLVLTWSNVFRPPRMSIPDLPSSFMTLWKLLGLPEPQLPHQKMKKYPTGLEDWISNMCREHL